MFGGSFGVQLMSFDPNGIEAQLAINGERNSRFVNRLKRVNSDIVVLEKSGFSDYLDRLELTRWLKKVRRELKSNGGNLMGRDTAEEEDDDEDRKMPANEDDTPDKSSQVGRDTAEEEEDDEDCKMPAEEEEDGEEDEAKSSLKSENTMVEANERTPKASLLTSKTAEEESDDDSPAGIAKPSSSDTAPAFKSSDDTLGQLKGPPEKNLLMSNMLKFDTDSKSAPVGNLKTDDNDSDELSEAEDQVPEDELEDVPVEAAVDNEEEEEELPPPPRKKPKVQSSLMSFFGQQG